MGEHRKNKGVVQVWERGRSESEALHNRFSAFWGHSTAADKALDPNCSQLFKIRNGRRALIHEKNGSSGWTRTSNPPGNRVIAIRCWRAAVYSDSVSKLGAAIVDRGFVNDPSFVQIEPHSALRQHVDFLWMLDNASPANSSASHLVFPDGGVDIVVPWSRSSSSMTPAGPPSMVR